MPARLLSFVGGKRASGQGSEQDANDLAAKMQSLKDLRRRSLERPKSESGRRPGSSRGSSRKNSPRRGPEAKIDMVIESPPLVLYGPPSSSTGALLSGQLRLQVEEPELLVQHFEVVLNVAITTHKPVSTHCRDCLVQTTQLDRWNFLTEPTTFKHGVHCFPVSHLFPGHLPASVRTSLGDVKYEFVATARTGRDERADHLTFRKTIDLQRAIIQGNERPSVRLFPPTNITAHVSMNPVIHPIGDFNVYFRLVGMVSKQKTTQVRWRLRKALWRIEEEAEMVSPACAKHAHKVGGDGKGIRHVETRTIGTGDFRRGWKGNPNENDGEVEMEFQAGINPAKDPVCNVQTASGLSISHKLILEMIVAEEWCPNANTSSITPTGAARILRMQFDLIVTQRSGLGISWDEEQPPMYSDVPASPPTYTNMDHAETGTLEREDTIDRLEL